MKTLKQVGLMMLMGISTVMINGCAGKDGAPGAQGPSGNANVTTFNQTAAPGNWQADGYSGWLCTFNVTGFNPTLGANEVYFSTDNSNWFALPLTVSSDETIAYGFNSSSLTINCTMIGTTPLNHPTNTWYFKIVNIPPAIKKLNQNTNWKNYSEVKTALNLQN